MAFRNLTCITICSILLLAACKTDKNKKEELATVADSIPKFEPNWESIKKNYKDPKWFSDDKFGIFIHLGAYAVPAFGLEWSPRQMYMDTATFSAQMDLGRKGPNLTYLHHKKTWGRTIDMVDNYRPDILYFDFYVDIDDFAELRPKLAAYYYNKGEEWGKEVFINDKNFGHEAFPEGIVIYDLERGKLPGPARTYHSVRAGFPIYLSSCIRRTKREECTGSELSFSAVLGEVKYKISRILLFKF